MKNPEKSNAKKNTETRIAVWLAVQSFVIILAAMAAFLFVDFMSHVPLFGGDGNLGISIGLALGMIIPFSALLGGVNNYLNKTTLNHVTTISEAMEKAANGDFETELVMTGSGSAARIYEDIYDNYNKMCAELKQVQILRNDFINSYSHEFKTPITSINGFAELLLSQNVTEEERSQYLRIIADESARLADLANSTILLSKLDSQTIITDKNLYSLDEQLRHCSIVLSSQWQAKNIRIDNELSELQYHGNSQLMEQLWLNLLNNAIKFTPENGEIKVSLSSIDTEITVSVSDSGIGMNEETTAHIFEKYYMGEKTHNKQGLGLGLSIVQRIVCLADGEIYVSSRPNAGSTFTVKLPVNTK